MLKVIFLFAMLKAYQKIPMLPACHTDALP